MFHILIPTVDALPCLRLTLEAYRLLCPAVPVTVVVGGGDPATVQFLQRCQDVETLALADNRGFAGNVNAGLRHLEGEHVLLSNDDVVPLTPDFPGKLRKHLEGEAGAVGAGTNFGLRYQIYNGTLGVEEVPCLSFFWILLRAEALADAGLADEIFEVGGCEDIDWCFKARRQGWKLLLDRSIQVHHWGSQTLRRQDDIDAITKRNRRILEMRYPELRKTNGSASPDQIPEHVRSA